MRDYPSPSRSVRTTSAHAAVDWAVAAGKSDDLVRLIDANVRRQKRRRVAISSVTLLLLAVTGGYIWSSNLRHTEQPAAVIASASVDRPEERILADGSIVQLRTGARIKVAYSDARRQVTLVSGEAHFQVTKNANRPFVVIAQGIEVRAVGTAFQVGLSPSNIDVLVTEGRVAVSRPSETIPVNAKMPPSTPGVTVDAGESVHVGMSEELPAAAPVSPQTMEARTAWRVPMLEFSDTPLSEAVTLFNQNSRDRLVLEPALGELRVGGRLRADNTDSFLRLLRNEFGIEATKTAGGINLSRP